jgi:hypothetical protein
MTPEPRDGVGVGTHVGDLLEGLLALVSAHVKLARAELAQVGRDLGRRAALGAGVAALAVLGDVFVAVAAALALERVLDAPLAFLVVGLAHVALAGLALAALTRRAPAAELRGGAELDQTLTAIAAELRDLRGPRSAPRPPPPAGQELAHVYVRG